MWLEIIGEHSNHNEEIKHGVSVLLQCRSQYRDEGVQQVTHHNLCYYVMCAISVFSLGISAIMGLNRNQALFPRSALAGAFNFVTFMCGLVPMRSSGAMPARSLLSASRLPVVMSEQL